MSLELGTSGAYIRSITSGNALPSVKELFNIIQYFNLTPAEFFSDFGLAPSPRSQVVRHLLEMSEEDLNKVLQFIDWIQK